VRHDRLGQLSPAAIRNAGQYTAMEANDFFPDHLHVGGPEFLERILCAGVGRSVADGSDVVRQRVKPNIDDMLGSSGTGMPQENVERLMDWSRSPERTNAATSLRRVSGE